MWSMVVCVLQSYYGIFMPTRKNLAPAADDEGQMIPATRVSVMYWSMALRSFRRKRGIGGPWEEWCLGAGQWGSHMISGGGGETVWDLSWFLHGGRAES